MMLYLDFFICNFLSFHMHGYEKPCINVFKAYIDPSVLCIRKLHLESPCKYDFIPTINCKDWYKTSYTNDIKFHFKEEIVCNNTSFHQV